MLRSYAIGYLGKPFEQGYIGFSGENNLFIVLSIEEGTTQEQGDSLLQRFKQELSVQQLTSLADFEASISALIVKLNFPAHVNMAAGWFANDILYVKTIGKGQIYFRRGKDFDLLMSGDKSASGYLQEYDMALFTTSKITELFGQTHDIKAFVDLDAPEDIVERLKNEGYDDEAKGFAGLFVEFSTQVREQTGFPVATQPAAVAPSTATQPAPVSTTSVVAPEMIVDKKKQLSLDPVPSGPPQHINIPGSPQGPGFGPRRSFSLGPYLQLLKTRKIALLFVIILFGILLWSVVFGYQRRAAAQLQKKVETTSQAIDTKLKEAEDEAFLDPDRALALIEEAKSDLQELKEEVGDKKPDEVKKIQTKIDETESRIVKREEKEYKEFYDLALEDKEAQGDAVYLEGTLLAILDKTNSKVYLLDLEKKSITQYTTKEVASASDVALYNEEVFFLSQSNGIYKFTSQTKARQVIESDKDWGKISDMEIYNGNMYLLDSEEGDIYKYLVAESGYSDKSSYFTGGAPSDLSSSTDMVIDSAVYVASGEKVLKYLSGAPDTFETNYPEKAPTLTGVYTNQDIELVYAWDTKGGVIYVLGKDGEYNRQLAAGIVRKAKDVFVYNDQTFILDGKKLYTITLD